LTIVGITFGCHRYSSLGVHSRCQMFSI
jgi:hypothetical protein